MTSIPASDIVNVQSAVMSSGGTPLAFNGLLLTTNSRLPIGSVLSFPSASSISSYFGGSDALVASAETYFLGFDSSDIKPTAIELARYPKTDCGAWLRGASLAGVSLAALQAISGTLIITVDGYTWTSGNINLATASSPSDAASKIQTALGLSPVTQAVVTGSIGAIVTGSIAHNTCTGYISATTMTVSAIGVGTVLGAGQVITGSGITTGTTIVRQLTGTNHGDIGTYEVSISQTAGSVGSQISCTLTGAGFTVTGVTAGVLEVGQVLSGGATASGTTITGFGSGTGGDGTYPVTISQTVGSRTINAAGTNLVVTSVTSGTLAVGMTVTGPSVTSGTIIIALGTGIGADGTYVVSEAQYVTSETITATGTPPTVTYDSIAGAFLIASALTGFISTISDASGTITTGLKLTAPLGAALSQGAAAASPGTFMDGLVNADQNWATLITHFSPDVEPATNVRMAFAEWINAQGNKYHYIAWSSDQTQATTVPATTSLGYLINDSTYSGTSVVYAPTADAARQIAMFVSGSIASIDFNSRNGRVNLSFKSQSGIIPTVTDQFTADNLVANYCNFYGAWATRAQRFVGFYPGSVSGQFEWIDSYINQIWLKDAFTLADMTLLFNRKSIPYNGDGTGLERGAASDPIFAGLNFGAIRKGVQPSALQAAEINQDAGLNIAGSYSASGTFTPSVLTNLGYYLQVIQPTAQVRGLRGSPQIRFWYMDGGSVQKIDMTAINVQ